MMIGLCSLGTMGWTIAQGDAARGRPGFLITTPAFLQYFGLSSNNSLPPRDRSPGR
jgi:chromosome segregation and condensation protein ScpB